MSTSRRARSQRSRSNRVAEAAPAGQASSALLPSAPLPELHTAAEVAAWLKTTVHAVYAKAERGALPGAWHYGRRLYFLRSELLRLVEQGRVPHLGVPGGGT